MNPTAVPVAVVAVLVGLDPKTIRRGRLLPVVTLTRGRKIVWLADLAAWMIQSKAAATEAAAVGVIEAAMVAHAARTRRNRSRGRVKK